MHRPNSAVRRLSCRLCAVPALLTAALAASPLAAAPPRGIGQNPDWPCRQILVSKISPAAVWSGPAIEGINWREDHAVAALAAQLAARRTPLEETQRLIGEFAKAQGPEAKQKLIVLFAGLFETLNEERSQIIDGLLRFGAKQRELAAKIRAERSEARNAVRQDAPAAAPSEEDSTAHGLDWDLRVFDERRQTIAFVCETPALIEQRLFALAKIIQSYLD
jgi:hypothetical protein